MITEDEAYQIAITYFPELIKKRWIKIVDSLPERAHPVFCESIEDEFWCIQYCSYDKDSEFSGFCPSCGIIVSKKNGKVLFHNSLSDEG
jgi:hypothetical protein